MTCGFCGIPLTKNKAGAYKAGKPFCDRICFSHYMTGRSAIFAGSFNGRTARSDRANAGSSPAPAANLSAQQGGPC